MSITRRLPRNLWAFAALVLVLSATFVLTTPKTVLACQPEFRCGSEFYYFSDASHTVLVGIRGWECNPCTGYSWGTTSDHIEWYPQPCCP